MAKKLNMQAALMGQTEVAANESAPTPATRRAPAPINDTAGQAGGRAPSRIGKKQIGAWLHPDFDRSLLLIMAKSASGTGKQDLIAEALNDLFRKHNVPTVNEK